jgi:hypothetical protein
MSYPLFLQRNSKDAKKVEKELAYLKKCLEYWYAWERCANYETKV